MGKNKQKTNDLVKKIIENVVDNRYIYSVIMTTVLTIIGFFINKTSMENWIVTTDKTFCLWLNIKFFALILSSYELFNIITNNKKTMSVAGTIVLAFSGCIMNNLTKIDSIVIGNIITVLIYKIINSEKNNKNIIPMFLIIALSVSYMYTFRPFAISFGYVFFALIAWIIAKNIKTLKNNKTKMMMVICTIILSVLGAVITELYFGKYYGDTIEANMSAGFSGLFTFLYTPLLPFFELKNVDIFSGIFSIFPIPMAIALYYMYKSEKHAEFLFPITVITVLETVYCISGFPEIISKFTMLSGASAVRVVPAVQFANLVILFYILGNFEDKLFKLTHAIRVTIIAICVLAFISYPTTFDTTGYLYLFAAEFSLFIFLFLNYHDKNYKKVLLYLLAIISLISGIPVLI